MWLLSICIYNNIYLYGDPLVPSYRSCQALAFRDVKFHDQIKRQLLQHHQLHKFLPYLVLTYPTYNGMYYGLHFLTSQDTHCPWDWIYWFSSCSKNISMFLHFLSAKYGCFLKWWYPQNTPKWSFLVGKPMVVGETQHFRKPPFRDFRGTMAPI